jgi:predicted Fe-S protein YdhL (DUF1289 family)
MNAINETPTPEEIAAFRRMSPEEQQAHLKKLRAEAEAMLDEADELKAWHRARKVVPLGVHPSEAP